MARAKGMQKKYVQMSQLDPMNITLDGTQRMFATKISSKKL
jgi:hypothetical protein